MTTVVKDFKDYAYDDEGEEDEEVFKREDKFWEEEIDFMLPTRTISETMVASCTASGSNVSDACSDLCFIRCKSKPEAATTIANILYLSLSLF